MTLIPVDFLRHAVSQSHKAANFHLERTQLRLISPETEAIRRVNSGIEQDVSCTSYGEGNSPHLDG